MKSLSQYIKEAYDWTDKFHDNIQIDVKTVAEFYEWYDMTKYKSFEDFATRSKTIRSYDKDILSTIESSWNQSIHRNDAADMVRNKDDMYFTLWSNVSGQTTLQMKIDGFLEYLPITKRHRNKYEKKW